MQADPEGQPYRVFATEREYRDHVARIVGWRIGREQDRTRREARRADAAELLVAELEDENERLRRELEAMS